MKIHCVEISKNNSGHTFNLPHENKLINPKELKNKDAPEWELVTSDPVPSALKPSHFYLGEEILALPPSLSDAIVSDSGLPL